jgi:hypothetical protein
LIPALGGRDRKIDLCEFKASLVYTVYFRTVMAISLDKGLHRKTLPQKKKKKKKKSQVLVAHAFNPSTQEAEAGVFLSSRSAWSTE